MRPMGSMELGFGGALQLLVRATDKRLGLSVCLFTQPRHVPKTPTSKNLWVARVLGGESIPAYAGGDWGGLRFGACFAVVGWGVIYYREYNASVLYGITYGADRISCRTAYDAQGSYQDVRLSDERA